MSSYQGWSQILPKTKLPKQKKPKPIVRPFPGYLTPAEIQGLAVSGANAQLDPLRTDIHAQQAAAQGRSDAQGKAILAASQAVAGLMKEIGPRINSMYQTAAANQAGIAKGYSGGLQTAQDSTAAQTNAQLGLIGAPQGQMQHPGPEAANVLYGTGGAIPATTFSQQGAAFGSAAAQLPATALLRGQQDFGANIAKGQLEQANFEGMLRSVDQKYPGLLDSLISGMNKDQLQLFSINLQSKYLGLNTTKAAVTARSSIARVTGVDPMTGKPTATVQNQKANRAAAAQAKAQAKIAKQQTARTSAIQGRNAALRSARQKALDLALSNVGTPAKNPDPGNYRNKGIYLDANGKGTNDPKKARLEGRKKYAEVFNLVWQSVADDVLRYSSPAGKAQLTEQLRQIIKQVLISQGYKPTKPKPKPGQGALPATQGMPTWVAGP
jgi:hypothetical protein